MTPPSYISLAGPTASGKTAAAMAIARAFDVEIISVDSALVYRGMDIGTAKPSAAELALVPHHLVNIRDPLQPYSAAEFARDATRLIADINARGKLALLVGGTMLYFKALLDGIDDLPPADAAVRAAIDLQARQLGWPQLHAQLALADPVTAKRLHPGDTQRIARALEVLHITGKPMSSFFTDKAGGKSAEKSKDKSGDEAAEHLAVAAAAATLISLEPSNRAWLHERIAQRFDAMLEDGLVDEVTALRARGDLNPDLPSMRCVGYRQTWAMLDGELPRVELRDRGIFATRQLAKRQLTWLRSMPERTVVACDEAGASDQVLELVQQAMADAT